MMTTSIASGIDRQDGAAMSEKNVYGQACPTCTGVEDGECLDCGGTGIINHVCQTHADPTQDTSPPTCVVCGEKARERAITTTPAGRESWPALTKPLWDALTEDELSDAHIDDLITRRDAMKARARRREAVAKVYRDRARMLTDWIDSKIDERSWEIANRVPDWRSDW